MGVADFLEVLVDGTLGVAVPCHRPILRTSDLEGKKDSLHVLVLERENIKKGFPYLLVPQKLVRTVCVNNSIHVGELGPERGKSVIDCVFKEVRFISVHNHP